MIYLVIFFLFKNTANIYLRQFNCRRDLRPPKLKRNQKVLSDEEVLKDIPVYYDPLPSPPPTDEKDLKARFLFYFN